MSLKTETLFGTVDKVAIAIARLRQFEKQALLKDPEGYYLAFSGGKDSQCIYHLAVMAGVKFRAYMHLTSVDAPEVLRFVRDNYPDVVRERPEKTMWKLIPERKMPPTRLARYCCNELKERKGSGRFVITGVRWAESVQRSGRRMVETCLKDSQKSYLHPIIEWNDEDVWEFLNSNNIPHCRLYDEGFTRIGCIGCPMGSAKQREKQFERWPRFKELYMRAFAECVKVRNERGLKSTDEFSSAESMFNWWMSERVKIDTEPGLFDFNEVDDE